MDFRTLLLARAHAKVNLALSVGPPRPEGDPAAGLHPIATWMACVELYDDISFSRLLPGDQSRYQVVGETDAPRHDPVDWPPEADLAVRSHKMLEELAGRPLPVRITLRKRIPVGGGLGGGSSDAGATLVGINRMFGLDLPLSRLRELSMALGTDIAFFLDEEVFGGKRAAPRPAVVTGIGERVERAERVAGHLVLIVPPFACPTEAVYRAFDRLGPSALREEQVRALAAAGAPDPSMLFNDLEHAAEQVEPRLGELRRRIRELLGRTAHMSGSGSTLFVFAEATGPNTADVLADRVQAALPGVAAVATRLI